MKASRRWNFFSKNIKKYIPKNSEILLVSGSINEFKIMQEQHYNNITLTYFDKILLDEIKSNFKSLKFKYFFLDLVNLNGLKKKFDYVVLSNTLHHLNKPHQGLVNLYDISNKGVLIFESNESSFIKLAAKLGFIEKYENSSIDMDGKGGLMNTNIPNFIYRWKKNEIIKTINSFDPAMENKIFFEYDYDLYNRGVQRNYTTAQKFLEPFLKYIMNIFFKLFKKQGNLLIFFIDKLNAKKRSL